MRRRSFGERLEDLRDLLTMTVHGAESADELAAVGTEVDHARDQILSRLQVQGGKHR